MSLKTIIVLYKEKESKITLNLEEITSYSLLKQKILSFYNELNTSFTYHLMAINTSSPYTLLDEENFNQIINEKIEGDELKLFLNKINPEEANNKDNSDYNKIMEENDDDFIIDNEKEDKNDSNKKENKDKNIIDNDINNNNIDIDKQLKINENFNIINEEINIDNINNDQDLFNQTDEMMKKIDKLIGDENDYQLLKHSKSLDNRKENDNKINLDNKASGIKINEKENEVIAPFPFSHKNQNLNINNINNMNNDNENENIDNFNQNSLNSKFLNQETFKSSICLICNSQLSDIKYICCICDNCILCDNCEKDHYHPCFKLKTNFLSTKLDIYKFISSFYSFKTNSKNFFTKLFTKEHEIKIFPLSDKKVTLRPNKNFIFPIKIKSYTNNSVNSSNFEIIPKNNKMIKILNKYPKFNLGPDSKYVLKLKCKTKRNLGKEKIEFYLFSDSLILKNKEGLNFSIDFEINEDWDEEQLNINFEYNEYAILYSKEHKQMALDILKSYGNKILNKDFIKNVFDILVKNNWDKNVAINKIKDLKK